MEINSNTIVTLKNGLGEIVKALDTIKAQQEYIKEAAAAMSEKTEVPVKFIKRMGKLIQASQVVTHRSEMDEFGDLLDAVVGSVITNSGNTQL